MKKILSIILTFVLNSSYGQFNFELPNDSVYKERKMSIQFQTEDYYRQMNIRNEILDKFIKGGYIDNNMKDRSSKELTKDNRFGGESYTQLNFYDFKTSLFNKERLGYYIGIGYRNYISGNITQDLFNLVMYGNEAYQNTELNLNNVRLNQYAYYKLNFGLFDKKTKSEGNLSFLYGNRLMKGEILNGELFTNEDVVNFKANGFLSLSDQSKTNAFDPNGFGVSADFKINLPVKWFKKMTTVQIKADNIGFIAWNRFTKTYSVDSSYSFQGFELNEVFQGNQPGNNNTNWLDSLNIKENSASKITWLPARITIAKVVDELSDAKFQTSFGVRLITTRDYFPMVFFGVYYRPINWFACSGSIRYGGFGGLDGGIRFDFFAKDFLAISISTSNVYGTFFNSGFGRSVNLGIRGNIR